MEVRDPELQAHFNACADKTQNEARLENLEVPQAAQEDQPSISKKSALKD